MRCAGMGEALLVVALGRCLVALNLERLARFDMGAIKLFGLKDVLMTATE